MLRNTLKRQTEKPLLRYIGVGGTIYLLELVVIFIAQRAGASTVLAVAISFWIGLLISFAAQKAITFRDRRLHRKVLVPQLLAVGLLVVFNFLFTIFVAHLLQSLLPAALVRTLALGATTIWNFYLYKTHIFKVPIID